MNSKKYNPQPFLAKRIAQFAPYSKKKHIYALFMRFLFGDIKGLHYIIKNTRKNDHDKA
jgi:hypothetical protein